MSDIDFAKLVIAFVAFFIAFSFLTGMGIRLARLGYDYMSWTLAFVARPTKPAPNPGGAEP